MKTAVFGMTRMGKSNTVKTLAVATYRHSKLISEPIGQLLFDPQGEYANPNAQDDDTALAQLGEDAVIYRFGADPAAGDARPLQINFFDPAQIDAAQQLIGSRPGRVGIRRATSITSSPPNWLTPSPARAGP